MPKRTWEEYTSSAVQVMETEEKCKFLLGQIFAEWAEEYGHGSIKKIAGEVGLSTVSVRSYIKVAKVFPEEERAEDFSWSCHMLWANSSDPYYWRNRSIAEGWSFGQIKEQMKLAKENKPREEEAKAVGTRLVRRLTDYHNEYGELAMDTIRQIYILTANWLGV